MRTLFLTLFCLFATAAATAQEYTPRGFSGSLGLLRSGITFDEIDGNGDASESGFGGALGLEYGFNDLISIFLSADGADMDGASLAHVELGARLHLRADERIFPFAQVALAGLGLEGDDEELDDDITLSGGGLSLGVGVKYFFSPRLALNIQGAYATGEFTDIEAGNVSLKDLDLDVTTTRFGFGIQYYFTK